MVEKTKTIGELIEALKLEYLKNQPNNTPKTWRSWATTYAATLNWLPQNESLSYSSLDTLLRSTDANSAARVRDCYAIQKLCQLANFSFDTDSYRGKYSAQEITLPGDDEIEEGFQMILSIPDRTQNKNNQASKAWYFGMLATYGLRTAEVFSIYWDTSFKDKRNTITINSDNKTGKSRIVYPVYPEWVERFNLLNIKMPRLDCAKHRRANKINDWFDTARIKFNG